MFALLPPPQQIRFTGNDFVPESGVKIFVAPWEMEDATIEILAPALKKIGCEGDWTEMPLPGPEGACLAIASSPEKAKKMAKLAAEGLDKDIPTPTIHRDGPYMASETTLARRAAESLNRKDSDEAYYIIIDTDGIAVCGRSRRGMFWGVQTLCQAVADCPRGRAPGVEMRDWPNQAVRGVHLDMKYFYQKPSATKDWLRGLSSLKINTALFEYEDKFPYEQHKFLRHSAAMTPNQLADVLDTARKYHVSVIPLIQSLGHLEYCLKHDELKDIREMPDIYTQACPTNPDSLKFVCDMIDEVMEWHPDVEYFHIGGDETGWLGECPRCKQAAKKKGEVELYLGHITAVLKHVVAKGKKPILWDDIVRTQPDKVARIPRETILAYWDYGPTREEHRERKIPPVLEKFYRTKGRRAALLPDTLSYFPYFDFYQQKGFEVLAMPCLNYGTILPNYAHSGRNTIKFAEKATACDGLGTINTQWACFHTPFGASWYGYALTAQSTWSMPPASLDEFDDLFSRSMMGMNDATLVAALGMASEGVGFRVEGAKRPFNLLHYAVMDAEIHYDEGFLGRQKYGTATAEIDYIKVARRKVEMMKNNPQRPDVIARMAWVESQMDGALALIKNARPKSPRGKLAKQFIEVGAEFKKTRINTMRLLMGKESRHSSAESALRAERRIMKHLREVYAKSLHANSLEKEIRILFEGELAALEKLAEN